ncbi:MAG: M16 family metallopeptidase [Bryobacteraceae bacterium]
MKILLTILLAAGLASAATTKPPVNAEVLKVKLPHAKEAVLANGLRLLVLEGYNQLPVFTLQIVILSGGLSDPPEHRGIANFTAAMLKEGTATRSSRELADQLATLGVTLNADSGLSTFTTNITATGLSKNLDPALAIIADVVRHASFPADEFDKYKSRTVSQLQLQHSNPEFLAQERLSRAI